MADRKFAVDDTYCSFKTRIIIIVIMYLLWDPTEWVNLQQKKFLI
jgi:hypothetical protein